VPAVAATTAARGLLVSYPDAAVWGAGLRRFECQQVRGPDGGEMLQVLCECSIYKRGYDRG